MSSRGVSGRLCSALLIVALGACGSDPTTAPEATAEVIATTATTTSSTMTSSTTTSSTTTATVTTMVTTPPTTLAPGWVEIDAASVTGQVFPPCCADTWHGVPSPPFGPQDQPLVDGDYPVSGSWPTDPGSPLQLEVFRFEQCAVLPEFSCEDPGGAYAPDQLGIDGSAVRTMTLPLDDTVRVVVAGWGEDPEGFGVLVVEQATGSEMAVLVDEVDEAYSEVFAERLAAGEDPDAIIADVMANPVGGFESAAGSGGAVLFTPAAGPSLLFQQVFAYVDDQRVVGRGSDVLTIRSIEVVDGEVTVNVFAGYYP